MKDFFLKTKFESWIGMALVIGGAITEDKHMLTVGTIFICTASILLELDKKIK